MPRITRIDVRVYEIPTDAPEADGTLEWSSTTMVVVEIAAGDVKGLGYTYAHAAAALVVAGKLAGCLDGEDPFATQRLHHSMRRAVRNMGSRGIAANAISACDVALWDLKARLLGVPLADLFGRARDCVTIYGSGGFTSYPDRRLREQLGSWVTESGCRSVKMKFGADPHRDFARMEAARDAIGDADLMIDANGAFDRKSALAIAERAADLDVVWFEEPVSSDDLAGLRLLRDRAPARMKIAAGEYGYESFYFRRMLEAGSVDVLQADATRCLGYTGFLEAAAVSAAFSIPLSAHTAPALHLPVCCSAPGLLNLEWFHDHVRIEQMLFDGAPVAKDGHIAPDLSRPGNGLSFRRADAERFTSSP